MQQLDAKTINVVLKSKSHPALRKHIGAGIY